MANEKARPLTDKERSMLSAAIDVRVAMIKRAINGESNMDVRKIRESEMSDYQALRAAVNSSGVQLVIA